MPVERINRTSAPPLQGALITSLCRRHLTVAQRARIHVIVLGGAASITDRQYGTAVNYYCTNEVPSCTLAATF